MFRKLLSAITSTAVVAGLVTAGAVAGTVATAAPAAAAAVNIGTVEAQMDGHTGKSRDKTNAENCIRFAPPQLPDPAVSTIWVTNPTEAATSHGSSTGSCPNNLSRSTQSAVGITPTSEQSANTGQSFLLGTMRHYNNPINVAENPAKFVGDLNVRFQSTKFAFPYELFETPNGCSTNVDPEQNNCSDDILEFTDTPTGELLIDGYPFALVSSGFTAPDSEGRCPVTQTGAVKKKFITTEQTTTTGCLYGKLAQKRPVKLVKKVVWDQGVTAPTSTTDFPFTSTSDLVGSPWKTSPGNLTPPKTNGGTAEYQKPIRAGSETVTITEGTSPANWQFQDVKCVDGAGQAVQGVTTSGKTATLANVPDATSQASLAITCTYTNKFIPPGINVVKTASASEVKPGDTVTYTYVVTNTGISPLKNVTLGDNKCSPISGPVKTGGNTDALLEAGETWTYTCAQALQNTTTNTATATGKDPNNTTVTAQDDATVTVLKPGINVVKTASASEVKPGDTVTYTYKVTSTGDTPLKDVTLGDNKCSPISGPVKTGGNTDALLEAGETWTYTCAQALQNTTENTATAAGEDKLGQKVTDTDKVTVTVLKPGINVVKTASASEVKPGDTVTYTYKVTSTGDTPLKDVTLGDNKCSPISGPVKTGGNTDALLEAGEPAGGRKGGGEGNRHRDRAKPGINGEDRRPRGPGERTNHKGHGEPRKDGRGDNKCSPISGPVKTGGNTDALLEAGETWTYTCAQALQNTTENTATAAGEDKLGQKVTDTDKVTVTVLKPGINVVKTASASEVKPGDTVTYTYKVTSTGDTPLKDVTLGDNKCSPISGPVKTGGNTDALLEAGETWTYTCAQALQNTTENTATAAGEDKLGQKVTDTDKVTVTVLKPGINVVKTASASEVKPGDTVTYTYKVTSTGDTPLKDVTLGDNKCSPISGPVKTGGNTDALLEAGETWTYTCAQALQNTTENTATAAGEDKLGQKVTDTDKVTVTVLKPGINVVKTASASEVKPGDTVTYTYKVTSTGDTPLKDVTLGDNKCSPISGPVKTGGNTDALRRPGKPGPTPAPRRCRTPPRTPPPRPVRTNSGRRSPTPTRSP